MFRSDDSLIIRNSDLTNAVSHGIMNEGTAARLAEFVATKGATANADDENLRLLTGFNDIFVAVGLALFFGALSFVGQSIVPFVAPVAAWGLTEIFTRRMRMALPSIMLLVIFSASVFWAALRLMPENSSSEVSNWLDKNQPLAFAFAAAVTAGAAALHWWRFHVPITVAAGVAALVGVLMGLLAAALGTSFDRLFTPTLLVCGLGTFALAMHFDGQDRTRRTQKSDRAFWLHMLAAPLIVHPLVSNLRALSSGGPPMIIALFGLLALVALVIDRRALLVSSLSYLVIALSGVIAKTQGDNATGDWGESSGWAVLAVGIVVLLLSVAWRPLRVAIVTRLPSALQARVPVAQN